MAATTNASGPKMGDLLEDWLTAKRAGRRANDAGNTERARRSDLTRWATAIATVTGQLPPEPGHQDDPLNFVTTKSLGDSEVLLRALAWFAEQGLADATRQRLVSHLRGFCRWLTSRGHLNSDPTTIDELRVAAVVRELDDKAFTVDDVAAIRAIAQAAPPPRAASRWPTRDLAIVDTLAGCGPRVTELCALRIDSIDRDSDAALLRIRRGSKGGRPRDVPIPRQAVAAVDAYLTERHARTDRPPYPSDPLFVRTTGNPFTQQTIDRLLRSLAAAASVAPPTGAMGHAFRHHYGLQLALRGVPLPVIQQLMGHADPRTTAIYTRATGLDLTHALLDAGLL